MHLYCAQSRANQSRSFPARRSRASASHQFRCAPHRI